MGFKHRGAKHLLRAKRHRVRPIAKGFVPDIPLPAIFTFAVAGFGGALFLSYSSYPTGNAMSSARSSNEVPVYSARAVPRDPEKTSVPEPSVSAAEREEGAHTGSDRVEITEPAPSRSLVASSTRGGFEGFDGFSNSHAPNIHLALAGVPMAGGFSAASNSSGHVAPDAENLSSVPEPSTWLAGVALVVLVGARWLRSKWRRSQRPLR